MVAIHRCPNILILKGDVRGLGLEESEGTGRSGGRENCVWNIMYERRIKEKIVEHCDC